MCVFWLWNAPVGHTTRYYFLPAQDSALLFAEFFANLFVINLFYEILNCWLYYEIQTDLGNRVMSAFPSLQHRHANYLPRTTTCVRVIPTFLPPSPPSATFCVLAFFLPLFFSLFVSICLRIFFPVRACYWVIPAVRSGTEKKCNKLCVNMHLCGVSMRRKGKAIC